MRNTFRHYYQPSGEEFDRLWGDGLIVLDTNVLLNLYRYSLETRESLLNTLSQIRDRLWLPYQVGLEYQRNRIPRLIEQRNVYSGLVRSVDQFETNMGKKLEDHSRHPILEVDKAEAEVAKAASQVRDYFKELEKAHPDMPDGMAPGSEDSVRDRLDEIFKGRVGAPFDDDELEEIYKEGADRYAQQVPPGYKDAQNKDGTDVYGDLVIWKEILRRAERDNGSIIFVTDDRKGDWWEIAEGKKTIGPRPELRAEIYGVSEDVLFHMYKPTQFLEHAQARFGTESGITNDAVSEVREVSEWDRRVHELYARRSSLHQERNKLAHGVRGDTAGPGVPLNKSEVKQIGEWSERLTVLNERIEVAVSELRESRRRLVEAHGPSDEHGLTPHEMEDFQFMHSTALSTLHALETERDDVLDRLASLKMKINRRHLSANDEAEVLIKNRMEMVQAEIDSIDKALYDEETQDWTGLA